MDSEAASERDTTCVLCGYDLRGLPGDPVRCPECGGWTPIDARLVPAADVRYRTILLAIAATVSCLVALPAFVLTLQWFSERALASRFGALLPLLLWLVPTIAFRQLASGLRGWIRALAIAYACIYAWLLGVALTIAVTVASFSISDITFRIALTLISLLAGGCTIAAATLVYQATGLSDLAERVETRIWARLYRLKPPDQKLV